MGDNMPNHRRVLVCQETPCLSMGSGAVYQALKQEVALQGVTNVAIEMSGCHGHGLCGYGPSVVVEPDGIFYIRVEANDAPEIVSSHLRDGKMVDRLLYSDPDTGENVPLLSEVNFYKRQQRIILRNCGRVNPERIDDCEARGDYTALKKAVLQMTPELVIEEIKKSGLRGRGGAGFPTGQKWEFCRSSPGDKKYIICNADEGDPGAFMDRSILEADPHALLEGITIGAYAIGSNEGFIYVRAEYPLAVYRVKLAISQARERGFLGRNILGTNFSFDIEVREGAGAFVCGEETALMASIESKRGMPKPRPPFPAQSGVNGKPSNINNVKTLTAVPAIIGNGADWFASIGTEKSKGTAVFALSGKIVNGGLVEVPMGTRLSDIIFDIGGGIPRGKSLKAVQTGGPSGGCIPARFLNTFVDYDTLAQMGSILGSGGMVVLDDSTCMVEIARYFVSFTQAESCGKCVPCRLGTRQMLEILTRITEGKGHGSDIDNLVNIATTMKESALCGLGQTCPNPVLSTIRYFREEYETHIRDKKCTAAACNALMISPCQHTCPVGINIPKYVAHIANEEYLNAIATIRERNPFPAICGRICHHPCESKCRRGELDDPVAIRSLKRYAADWYFVHMHELPAPEPFSVTHNQRVAVVGAGPTGLSCAYFLAQMGYQSTVFEALPVGGGMLSVALPEFRLPSKVIDKEIDYIAKCGVEIRYNSPINKSFTIEHLRNDGYEAVFIAAGSQRSLRVGIPGELEELEGFYYGLKFLRDVKLGRELNIQGHVAIIGGGNVGVDCAQTALRLGANEASVYERRSPEEMRAAQVEYDEAVSEGVQVNLLVSPTRIVNDHWKVAGLQCIRMRVAERDSEGKERLEVVPGSEFFVHADTVIVAIGQAPDLSFLPPDSALERTVWERLVVDDNTLSTNVPGVFAGGDFAVGPGKIIEAIAAGRRSAIAIDKYLQGDTSRVEIYDLRQGIIGEVAEAEEETWEAQPREEVPMLAVGDRKRSFSEIELCMPEDQAKREAKRCLRCDLET